MNATMKLQGGLESDFQNKLHNRAAYVIQVASGFYVARRDCRGTLSGGGLRTFCARADAEDYILNMIQWLGGSWSKARVVAL